MQTGQHVAVKVTNSALFTPAEARSRFALEALAAQRLSHPNIVKILDHGEDEQHNALLVMELLSGTSLQHSLNQRTRLSPYETIRTLLPIMDALAYAHEQGVIHRDIKPENVFLSRSGDGSIVPKLLDFGLAVVSQITRFTRSGIMLGTLPYMAPEQILQSQVTVQSDIWSLGTVLFRCLAGRLPHSMEGDSVAVLRRIAREPAPALHTVAPEVGARLCATIDRALSHHLNRRYPSVAAFRAALQDAAHQEHLEVPDYGPPTDQPRTPAAPEDHPTVALQAPPLRLPQS